MYRLIMNMKDGTEHYLADFLPGRTSWVGVRSLEALVQWFNEAMQLSAQPDYVPSTVPTKSVQQLAGERPLPLWQRAVAILGAFICMLVIGAIPIQLALTLYPESLHFVIALLVAVFIASATMINRYFRAKRAREEHWL